MRRRLGPALALALLAVVPMSACQRAGSDDTPRIRVLSETQLRSVLLDPADIGTDFTIDTTRGSFYASCIGALFDLPDVGVPETQARQILSPVQERWPAVTQGVADFKSSAAAEIVVDRMINKLDGCDPVRFHNGPEYIEADVRTDEDESSPSVDHQLNVRAIGAATYEGDPRHYPIGWWFSVMRIDHHLLVTAYTDLRTEEHGNMESLNQALVERLLAVAEGKKPPKVAPLDIEPTRVAEEPDSV